MADRTFNDVKINLTLKPQAERANVSSSQEDLAVQMGKIQQWYPGLNNYATCATAAGTAIKTVDCPGFELTTGTVVIVKFTITNTAAVADLQLNVNETGAKHIKYRNSNLSAASVLTANRIYAMLYDGTYWQIIGDLDTNSNTYDRTSVQTRIYAGAKGVFPYSLCAMDTVQRMQAFTTTGGTGTSKAFNSSEKFLYPPVIMYHSSSSTIANGSVIANNVLYEQYPSVNMQYNANVTTTSAYSQYKPLYIECTFDSNGYWSPTGITQTFTSGKYYILLGCMYNTSIYQLALFAQHPLYYYDGTNLIDGESHLQDGRYIPMTGSYDISGNLGFNGTNHGYYLKDSTGLAFPGIYYNSTDFWIGATQKTTTHFTGRTMISTGYNSESGKGNTSIWVYVPNSTNTGSNGYEVFNSTNLVTGAGITISTADHQLYNGAVYTIKHSNSVTARTDYMQPYVKYDAQGHITGSSYWMATARGTGGVAGWVKVATIKHKMHYDNTPFLLDVSQRGNTISYRIHIRWNSVDNVDPSLGEFLIASDHAWESISPRAYIIKSATSTWDLYIFKLDSYEAIAMRLQPGRYFNDHTEWTWKDEQTDASVITGGTEATKKIYSTTDHTHDSLTSKILAEWDLDNTDGNFFFKGDSIFGVNNDEYVGIQADSGNYKFQLLRYGDKLLFRPNNADGSTNWHEWNCLMTPYNVTAEDGITATYYASNIVSDNPETAFWHSVTLKHSNSVTAVTTASLLKFKYDAQGHITGSSAVVKGDIPTLDYVPFKTVTAAGSDMNDYMNEDGWIKWNTSAGTNVPTRNWGILFTKALPNIQVFIPDNATGIYFRRKANATSDPTEWWGLTGSAGNTYNLNNLPGKYAFIVDETSDFASYAWHKFAEVTVTGNRADATITFLVSKTWTYGNGNPSREVGILNAHIRTSSTNVFETGEFRWIVAGDYIDPTEFVMVYIDTASTSCKVELWHKQKSRWDGWVFKVLKEHSRLAYGENPWTLFVHTGHGSATYTDGTGAIVSEIITIANTSASADEINSKVLTKSTLDGTAGNFFFKGDSLLGNINDWVGIQADAGNDKFQLIAISGGLMYRQNDTGGTNSTNWTDWTGLLTPSKVTTDTYLSAEATTTTTGSGDTAFIYNSGVKISHKAYTAYSSGLYKITVDAAGHVSAATALTITPTPSSKTHTNWDTTAERAYLVTKGWMSYWNGAYNSNNASNLTYCNRGAFGTIVTKSATDYVPNTTDGVNAAINLLATGSTVPVDDDYYISQWVNGGTTTTTYHRRPIVKLWQYMIDKSIAGYYNNAADFADAPWAKVVSMKCASASSYRQIVLLVSKIHYHSTDKYSWGILCIRFATNSSKNYDTTSGVGTCDWLVAHGNIATTDFKITYTNTGTTSTTVDIWCKAGHRYAGYSFKVLTDTMRGLSGLAYVGTSNIELFKVDDTSGVAETAITGTEITQTVTTIANTSAKANTVQGTLTNPTSETSYPIPFHATVSTGAKTLRNNNGLMHIIKEGTASASGYSVIRVGNDVASGTAGNKFGVLRLYSQNTSYVQLEAKSTTSAKTQWLSAMEGTLCCLDKNSTSYWGLYDGDASGTNWIRTTQNGFIPYAEGAFNASTTSSIGTDTWWFNRAYIRTIQTGVIKFRSGNTESNTTRSYLRLQQDLTGNYDWRLPPTSGEIMVRKGSVTAGASQAILYAGTTSGWGHQSVEVANIFKNWSLIVVNFISGSYGYSTTDKHSFNAVVPLDFVKIKGTSPSNPYVIPIPANGTNTDATEVIECTYVNDNTIDFNRSGSAGNIGKITIWGIY